jgi:hypothetical protein
MRRLALSLLATSLIAACASGPGGGYSTGNPPVVLNPGAQPLDPLARTATYVCEEGSTIVLTEGVPSARVTLNSGLEMQLARHGSLGGFSFGAPPFVVRGVGGNAVLESSGKTFRCRLR